MAIHDIPIYVRTAAARKAGEQERRLFESIRPDAGFQTLRKIAEGLADGCPHVKCKRTRDAFVRGFAV